MPKYTLTFIRSSEIAARHFILDSNLAEISSDIAQQGYFIVPSGSTDLMGRRSKAITVFRPFIISLEEAEGASDDELTFWPTP